MKTNLALIELCIASGVVVFGCAGSERAAAVPHTTPAALEILYHTVWNSADHEQLSPDRELVQLGVPDQSTLTLWHALDRAKKQAPEILVDGLPPAQGCVHRWAADNRELRGAEVPDGVHLTERIEVGCLVANKAKHVVTLNGIRVEAATAPGAADLSPFSFLAWSCNNPYTNRNRGLNFELNKLNSLALLRARSEGDIWPDGQPKQPSFSLALGDQIYVDGDNEGRAPDEELALFVGNFSQPRFELSDAPALLDMIYRYHLAIPPLDDALKAVPTAMVWDDHDIRDGWRSQGDEETNPFMLPYYGFARSAFVSYQGIRNPGVRGPVPDEMDVQFNWGPATSVYMMDGRTNRRFADKPGEGRILLPSQFTKLCRWLGEPDDCAGAAPKNGGQLQIGQDVPMLYVLGSPSPISTSEKQLSDIIEACSLTNKSLLGEGEDDIRDTWFCNRADRKRLLSMLANHFANHPLHRLVVVSGDVHWSGVTSLQYKDPTGKIFLFGYEVISSGVTNDHHKTHLENDGAWEAATLVNESGVQITSTAHGAINDSPSFAELRVVPSARWAPELSVIFYPTRQSSTKGEDAPRDLANYWRTLIGVHEVHEFNFQSNPHKDLGGAFFTRVPLPMTTPRGVGGWLHAASIVCDSRGVNSAETAARWYDTRLAETCGKIQR